MEDYDKQKIVVLKIKEKKITFLNRSIDKVINFPDLHGTKERKTITLVLDEEK